MQRWAPLDPFGNTMRSVNGRPAVLLPVSTAAPPAAPPPPLCCLALAAHRLPPAGHRLLDAHSAFRLSDVLTAIHPPLLLTPTI